MDYLNQSIQTEYIIELVAGAISLIIGSVILNKGIRWLKFIRVISGLFFFGSLAYIIGRIIINSSSQGTQILSQIYILAGCTLGVAIIGAIFCGCIPFIGNIALGSISGWTLWSLFSAFVPSLLVTLIASIVLALIFIVVVIYYKEKGQFIASIWLGSYFSVNGAGYIITGICRATLNPYDFSMALLITCILVIIVTFILFGIFWYLQTKRYSADVKDVEMQSDPVLPS